MKQSTRLFAAGLLTLLAFTQQADTVFAQEPFKDLQQGDFAYVQIRYLAEQGMIQGYQDGTFRSKSPITRREAKTLIQKTIGGENEGGKEKKETVISHPNRPINLAEAVKMIITAEEEVRGKPIEITPKESKNVFADVHGDEWFGPFMAKAKKRNIIRFGMGNLAEPGKIVTRNMMADMIYRTIKSRDTNRFFGKATFYSDFFEGRGTSSGEKFTQNGFTAANKELPFGTMVRVTNLKNGQHVDVRINDRGPFTTSLNLDLTSKAFNQIAALSEGIVPVQYEIIPPEKQESKPSSPKAATPATAPLPPKPPTKEPPKK